MRTIYFKDFVMKLWNKKKQVIALVIIFSVIFGYIGYTKANKTVSEEQLKEIEEYEAAIKEYDNLILELEDNIEIAREQVDNQEKYCDNSIYIKLDAQNIQVAELQYAIQTANNVGFILNSFVAYINEGSLRSHLSKVYSAVPEEYLKEIIACSTNGNILNVTIMHYDKEEALKISRFLAENLEKQQAQIKQIQGEFEMKKLDEVQYSKADISVLNTQNQALNNLRTYKNTLSDLNKKLIDQKNGKKYYIENNEPEAMELENPIKEAIKFMIFGGIFAIVLLLAIMSLRNIINGDLKSKEELLAANIAVLGSWKERVGYTPLLEQSIMDIRIFADLNQCTTIIMNCLSDDELIRKVIEDYKKSLKEYNIEVLCYFSSEKNMELLKQMIDVGNCILVAEVGKNTYTQIEEQVQLCEKFGVSMWGSIVVG